MTRRFHPAGWSALLAAVLGMTGSAGAAERNYDAAFAHLLALGYPDVKGGQLIRIEAEFINSASDAFQLETHPAPHGWLTQTPSNAPAVMIDLFGRRRYLKAPPKDGPSGSPPEKEEKEEGADGEEAADPEADVPFIIPAAWTNVDAVAYATAVTAFLTRPAPSNAAAEGEGAFLEVRENDPFSSSQEEGLPLFLASSFFLAAGLHRNGQTREAAALADAILSREKNPETLLGACVAILADNASSEIYGRFRKTGDWRRYAADLKALRERYGRRWLHYEEARELERKVALRLEPGPAPLPAGDYPAWALESVRSLLAGPVDRDVLENLDAYPWVLAPPPDSAAPAATNPLCRLLDGGMESVPLLLTLATNETPLYLVSRERGRMFYMEDRAQGVFLQAYSQEGAGSDDIFMPRRYYGSSSELERPLGLGEVARILLAPLDGQRSMLDDDDLAKVRAWYEANKGKPRRELAWHFLENEQDAVALELLFKEGSEAERKRVVDFILKQEGGRGGVHLAMRVKALLPAGEEAERFRKDYLALLQAQLKPASSNAAATELFVKGQGLDEYEKRMIEESIKAFEQEGKKAKPSDLAGILAGLSATNRSVGGSTLYEAAGRTPPAEAVTLITNRLLRAETPEVASAVLHMLYVVKEVTPEADDGEAEAEGAEPSPLNPPWRAKPDPRRANRFARSRETGLKPELSLERLGGFWRGLLADSRTNGWEKVRVEAAGMVEYFYGDSAGMQNLYEVRPLLGEELNQLTLERAMARLEKRSPPELPSLKAAREQDRAALEKSLAAVPEEGLPAALVQLEANEVLALSLEPGPAPALAARLTAAASRVVEAPAGCGIRSGSPFTTNELVRLIERMRTGTETNVISIERRPRAGGIVIRVLPEAPETGRFYELTYLARDGGLKPGTRVVLAEGGAPRVGRKGVQSDSGRCFWLPPAGVGPTNAPSNVDLDAKVVTSRGGYSMVESMRESLEGSFWKSAAHFCAATNAPLAPGAITISVIRTKEEKESSGRGGWETMDVDF